MCQLSVQNQEFLHFWSGVLWRSHPGAFFEPSTEVLIYLHSRVWWGTWGEKWGGGSKMAQSLFPSPVASTHISDFCCLFLGHSIVSVKLGRTVHSNCNCFWDVDCYKGIESILLTCTQVGLAVIKWNLLPFPVGMVVFRGMTCINACVHWRLWSFLYNICTFWHSRGWMANLERI